MENYQFAARPTTYRGVRMRSRLEAYYAQFLDQVHLPWEYEPTCFGGKSGQWVPDFRIGFTTYGPPWGMQYAYVEVKPAMTLDVGSLRRRMELAWESDPGALLMLAGNSDWSYYAFPFGVGGQWRSAYWVGMNGWGVDALSVGLRVDEDPKWDPWVLNGPRKWPLTQYDAEECTSFGNWHGAVTMGATVGQGS